MADIPLETLTPALIRAAVIDRAPPSAVRTLVQRLAPIVQASVARVLLRHGRAHRDVAQEVADFTQDVFEALLADGGRRLLAWDPTQASARTFFGLITERLVLNRLVSHKRNPWTDEAADPCELQDALTEPVDTERALASRDALRRLATRLEAELSPRDRELFRLLYVERAEVAEVMQRLGVSRDVVYQARRRLTQRVQALWDGLRAGVAR